MDIERTIERLRREAYGSDIEGLLLDAAATIEVLRDKYKARDALVDRLETDLFEARQEIEELRKGAPRREL